MYNGTYLGVRSISELYLAYVLGIYSQPVISRLHMSRYMKENKNKSSATAAIEHVQVAFLISLLYQELSVVIICRY